jgi:tRNA dimethylallyltransferase
MRAWYLVGPTASGKSEIAVALAEALDAEIVSADSRQIYRGMEIGTAAPDSSARARVRHHLIAVADPSEAWSAGRFAAAARSALADIADRGKAALVVGGSGLYVRALSTGLAPLPRDEAVRREIESEGRRAGAAALHRELIGLDPVAAAAIHPHNLHRIIRALEVCRISGRRVSELRRERANEAVGFPAPRFGLELPRAVLYARIDRRVEEILARGFLDEIRALVARGFDEAWPSCRALGYAEGLRCLRGQISEAEAVDEIRRRTRHFARRQLTWFRADREIRWFRWQGRGLETVVGELLAAARARAGAPRPPGAA